MLSLLLSQTVLFPQVTETLRVDDGQATSYGANAVSSYMEAVELPVPDSARILGLLFYPADPAGNAPSLTYCVWDDSSAGPGALLFKGTLASLSYDAWNYIDLSSQGLWVNRGYVFVGWSSENQSGDTLYYNWHDSFADGYNWWFDGNAWHRDSAFAGDFMIRAVAEVYYDVPEKDARAGPRARAWPNPCRGPLFVELSLAEAGPLEISLSDPAGRRILEIRPTLGRGTHRITLDPGLPPGAYLLRVQGPGLHLAEKIVVE